MSSIPRRVTITDSAELLAPAVDRLRGAGVDVRVLPDGTSPADAASAAADAAVVIDGVLAFREPELDRLTEARLIVRAGIGYDLIDVPAATARGIWVANVPDYCADEVADHTMLLLMACARRLDALGTVWRDAGRWLAYDRLPPVRRPSQQVLGIVGMGRIGERVATRAHAFGWQVIGQDAVLPPDVIRARGAHPVDLDELFARADAITLHCPLDAGTHHLVDAARLATTRPGVVIVNTSRGGLIDIDALDAALASGHVAAAGLDVLEDEPTVDLAQPVLTRANVIATGHTAWYSLDARRELALLCADEALRVLDGGLPRNPVNTLDAASRR
ncbi:MAG: C-terminal binding protein [Chloroflexi bacterium]|nr:C-terminal binding protein [Chloroflexota bacterium]